MKIALIRKDYLYSSGGAERYVYNLSHELAKSGHEVHIFANRWEPPRKSDIKIHYVPLIKVNSPVKNLSFVINLRKKLSFNSFDIVHSFSHVYPSDIYRMGDGIHKLWLKIETPSLYLRFFKYLNPRHLAILFLESQIFREGNYKKIVANSKLCYKQAQKYFNIPKEKLAIIYNGVDHKIFNPEVRERYFKKMRLKLGIDDKTLVILYISDGFILSDVTRSAFTAMPDTDLFCP